MRWNPEPVWPQRPAAVAVIALHGPLNASQSTNREFRQCFDEGGDLFRVFHHPSLQRLAILWRSSLDERRFGMHAQVAISRRLDYSRIVAGNTTRLHSQGANMIQVRADLRARRAIGETRSLR
jgi:hypothetical protein